jgi:hypothetical protein
MPEIKCLSIMQPWAALIIRGEKKVENRTWRTGYTGLLGIHASKTRSAINKLSDEKLAEWMPGWPDDEHGTGCLLGVVELEGCYRYRSLPPDLKKHEFAFSDPVNWCWVLRRPLRLVRPFPTSAKVGFFYLNVPDEYLPADLRSRMSVKSPSRQA